MLNFAENFQEKVSFVGRKCLPVSHRDLSSIPMLKKKINMAEPGGVTFISSQRQVDLCEDKGQPGLHSKF